MKQTIKSIASVLLLALTLFFLLVFVARGQEKEAATQEIMASGGSFMLQKTVTAGGGNKMQQSSMSLNGTAGQTIAGVKSNGGNFTLYSGFWTPDDFAPTAATATVGGRIKTADGRGIKNVNVTIVYPNGMTQTVLSSSMGYYSFAEIPVGETYSISVSAKRFSFSQPVQIRNVVDDIMDVDFIADVPIEATVQEQP